jgi:hypothetical protein
VLGFESTWRGEQRVGSTESTERGAQGVCREESTEYREGSTKSIERGASIQRGELIPESYAPRPEITPPRPYLNPPTVGRAVAVHMAFF